MSPGSPRRRPSPRAAAFASQLALDFGRAVAEERRRRGWTMRVLAESARISAQTIVGIEAGRPASMDVVGRLAVALGIRIEVESGPARRRSREPSDVVHSAMGEYEARLLALHGFKLAIDHPYQHFQFAGRADVLAWRRDPPALLHIENRTRLPDLQQVAGSFNAKCTYLAAVLAREIGVRRFESQTHVIAGLWSSEVIHVVRLRPATIRTLCPDPDDRLRAWLLGEPPRGGTSRSFVLLDPIASRRQQPFASLAAVLDGVRPRMRGYGDAADRLSRSDGARVRDGSTVGPVRGGARRGGT